MVSGKEALGRNLERIVRRKGFGYRELARAAGIAQPSVSRYISGQIEPGAGALYHMAKVLDCTMEELMEGYDG